MVSPRHSTPNLPAIAERSLSLSNDDVIIPSIPTTRTPVIPTLEIATLITSHLASSPSDLQNLSLLSRTFRNPAQKALFNAIRLHKPARTIDVCQFLSSNTRIGGYVDALAIFVGGDDEEEDPDTQNLISDEMISSAPPEPPPLPDEFWPSMREALQALPNLRFLTLYIHHLSPTPPSLLSLCTPHILSSVPFSLVSFHADLAWSPELSSFLSSQPRLADLYLADYDASKGAVSKCMLPALSVLESPNPEATSALVPHRPVQYLHTELPDVEEFRLDLRFPSLLAAISESSNPLKSLSFSRTTGFLPRLLRSPSTLASFTDLRYLGSIAYLPCPTARLEIAALVRVLPKLRAVALDVSSWPAEWNPVDTRVPARAKALAMEVAVYAKGVKCVVLYGAEPRLEDGEESDSEDEDMEDAEGEKERRAVVVRWTALSGPWASVGSRRGGSGSGGGRTAGRWSVGGGEGAEGVWREV